MKKLIEKVLAWGIEKQITGPNGKGTKEAQAAKVLEEARETYNAVVSIDEKEILDGIGDTQVTLIILCEMHGWHISNVASMAFAMSWDQFILGSRHVRALSIVEEVETLTRLVEEKDSEGIKRVIGSMMIDLGRLAARYNWTLQECLQAAYDVISKRSGAMIGGSFIKSSDLDDDFNEPLGKACVLGDTSCESCS